MAIVGPSPFGKQLCEVLGLDPRKTRKLVLVWEPKTITKVYVQQYLWTDQDKSLLDVIKQDKEAGQLKIEEVAEVDVTDTCHVQYVPSKS